MAPSIWNFFSAAAAGPCERQNAQRFDRLLAAYTNGAHILFRLALVLIAVMPVPITLDVVLRNVFHSYIPCITEVEMLVLVLIAYMCIPYVTARGGHIAIDILFDMFPEKTRDRLTLLALSLSVLACVITGLNAVGGGLANPNTTPELGAPEKWLIVYSGAGLLIIALGLLILWLRCLDRLIQKKDWAGLAMPLILTAFFCALPFLYKYSGVGLSRLVIGSCGFLLLFILMLVHVPIGFAMMAVALVGLFMVSRTPSAALTLIVDVPYRELANFVLVAVPMFMLMGELASVSGISGDMFDCFNKWLGKYPGGLACATVGGCAGFGAICGDSLATVITMSAVAYPHMAERKYDCGLSCGALAAGGTLGILIPPSMGFIFYSLMTENSVGRLFVAGIIPGLLLTALFIAIIIFRVKRQPALAPASPSYPLGERVKSLAGLIPMFVIFGIVVGGILYGKFTPGEGGAVGAVCAAVYALGRRRLTRTGLVAALSSTCLMVGKIFIILIAVYMFGSFLTASRLPMLLAKFVMNLDVNRYLVLFAVIAIYVFLGCVMTIMPMMMLTLPSIYPTIAALGFDGIWFGVITVIVMEMGLITPPVGINVFTMASLVPEASMAEIFKGVLPFFLGMCLCVLLIVLFPQLALCLL